MFGKFFIVLVGLYVVYYGLMFFMDVQRIRKNRAEEAGGDEVNIASAVAGYQAVDASAIIKGGRVGVPEDESDDKTNEEIKTDVSEEPDMDWDYADEERDESATDGSLIDGPADDSNLPFAFTESAADTEESGSGGNKRSLTPEIKTDIPNDDEFVPVEHSAGMTVPTLSKLFEEANLEESIFKGVLCA